MNHFKRSILPPPEQEADEVIRDVFDACADLRAYLEEEPQARAYILEHKTDLQFYLSDAATSLDQWAAEQREAA